MFALHAAQLHGGVPCESLEPPQPASTTTGSTTHPNRATIDMAETFRGRPPPKRAATSRALGARHQTLQSPRAVPADQLSRSSKTEPIDPAADLQELLSAVTRQLKRAI